MSPDKEFQILLRQHKFDVVSERNHIKYQNPEGKILVTSKTPSDRRAWHRMIQDLKRVVTNPVPTSAIVEEERQRRELESYIRIAAQSQKKAGIKGAGKKAKSKGTGINFIVKIIKEKTPEEKEAMRLGDLAAEAKREAKRTLALYEKGFTAKCVMHVEIAMQEEYAPDDGDNAYLRETLEKQLDFCEKVQAEVFAEKRKKGTRSLSEEASQEVLGRVWEWQQSRSPQDQTAYRHVMDAVNQMSPPYTRERMKSAIEWMLQEDSHGRAENLRNAKEMAKKIAGFYWKNRNEGVVLTFKPADDTEGSKRLKDAIDRGLAAWHRSMAIVKVS